MRLILAILLVISTATAATYISGIDGNSYVNTTTFYGNLACSYITGATSNLCTITSTPASNLTQMNSTGGIWNATLDCHNITGGSDGDYCADADTGGTASGMNGTGPYLYNSTGNITFNATYANTTYATINSTPAITNANLSCLNVSGATSDLCTLVDTNTYVNSACPTGNFTSAIAGSVLTCAQVNFTQISNTENVTYLNSTGGIWNATLDCHNITGGSDGDYCTDASGGSGLKAGGSYLYNTSTEIFFNATYGNTTYATINSTPAITNANISCSNVSGATSNLCTIADTDTNAGTLCAGDTTYLSGEGNCNDIDLVYWNECIDAYACGWVDCDGVAACETDPQVGDLQMTKWCRADALGNSIDCDVDPVSYSAGNASIIITGGNIYANQTYLDLYYLKTTGFDAANITSGTIDFARLPALTDTHTHNANNITAGSFSSGNFTFTGNVTITEKTCLNANCSAYIQYNATDNFIYIK